MTIGIKNFHKICHKIFNFRNEFDPIRNLKSFSVVIWKIS